jgi:MraZ protein
VVNSRGSGLFLGQYEHGLDDKNRLFLPARFRDKNKGPDFIMTQGLEGCLSLYPPSAWQSLAAKLDHLPLANKIEERAFKRLLLSAASEVEVDSQGRILIPQLLKDYARIQRDAVVIGVLQHIEIWAKERWELYRQQSRDTFEKAASQLEL